MIFVKKIIIIGQFNERTKEIQKRLAPYAEVSICSDNPTVAESIIGIGDPNLLFFNLDGFGEEHEKLFSFIAESCPDIPAVLAGDEEAVALFEKYDTNHQFSYISGDDAVTFEAVDAVSERIGLDMGLPDVGETVAEPKEKKTILVVDDSPMSLRGIKQMLDKKYQLMLATSAEQALKMLDRKTPDLIILDYEMPGCDGKQTLEMLRAREETKTLPVIFLTGHGDAEHIRSVLDLNPSAYFLKPPKADKINEMLDKLLGES